MLLIPSCLSTPRSRLDPPAHRSTSRRGNQTPSPPFPPASLIISSPDLQFGGHLATPALCILTPLTIYGLFYSCSSPSGCPAPLAEWLPNFTSLWWTEGLIDFKAFGIYLAWYAFTVAAWKFLPGELVEGTELRDGGRLKYKINGEIELSSPDLSLSRELT